MDLSNKKKTYLSCEFDKKVPLRLLKQYGYHDLLNLTNQDYETSLFWFIKYIDDKSVIKIKKYIVIKSKWLSYYDKQLPIIKNQYKYVQSSQNMSDYNYENYVSKIISDNWERESGEKGPHKPQIGFIKQQIIFTMAQIIYGQVSCLTIFRPNVLFIGPVGD